MFNEQHNDKKKVLASYLDRIELALKQCDLWQKMTPDLQSFESESPFFIDTMSANEWLQWVFLPRMRTLIESEHSVLPTNFTMLFYFEEAFKLQTKDVSCLLNAIRRLELFLT